MPLRAVLFDVDFTLAKPGPDLGPDGYRRLGREFGLDLDENVEVRVWDSTSEMRYLVLPQRPAGTEGMSEEQLADLVTRDVMIGAAKVTAAGASR